MVGLVRPAEIDDAAAIAAVHVASWRTTYRNLLPADFLTALDESSYEARWRRTIREGVGRVYVAEDQGRVVGFASGGRERAGEDRYAGELYAIYVLEGAQHRGHGKRLVQAVVTAIRQMKLPNMIVWVLRDNQPARAFYERLGGVYVRSQPITIGTSLLEEVSYGWRSLDSIRY